MRKDAYYFPHDANAQNDEKCLFIIAKYGMSAYGLYWCFIEAMHEQEDGKLTVKLLDGLAFRFKVDKEFMLQVYNDAISIGLFITDGTKFWSQRVLRNKDEFDKKRKQKSEAGKRGMYSRWHNNDITEDNVTITKYNKGKESKVKEIIGVKFCEKGEGVFFEDGSYQEFGQRQLQRFKEGDYKPHYIKKGQIE